MHVKRALVLLATLVGAGCTSSPGPNVYDDYEDADDRWSLVADGGLSDAREFDVPADAIHLRVRATFTADRGFHFTLYGPNDQISSNFVFSRGIEVREIEWVETPQPDEGTWRIGVDCVRQCRFAFGFYYYADLSSAPKLDNKHTGATRRFEGTSEGGGIRVHDFDVPADTKGLRLAWSLEATDKLQATLRTPTSASRFGFTLPYESLVNEAEYDAVTMPAAGRWSIAVTCKARCHYVFGVEY